MSRSYFTLKQLALVVVLIGSHALALGFSQSAFQYRTLVNQAFSLDLRGLLADGTPPAALKWDVIAGPAWLSNTDGVLRGTPTSSQIGAVNFSVAVSDGTAGALANIHIEVMTRPIWAQDSINLGIQTSGVPFLFNLAGKTWSGAPLRFFAVNLPTWMSINSVTGILTGTPRTSDTGRYQGSVIAESETLGRVSVTVTGEVTPSAHPPIFTENPVTLPNARADVPYTQDLAGYAVSPDGSVLTFSIIQGPSWITVSSNGTLFGTPRASDIGAISLTLQCTTVIGGMLYTATTVVQFNVTPASDTIEWVSSNIVAPNAIAATPYQIDLSDYLSNPTGVPVTFSVASFPSWITLTTSGILSGTPTRADVGVASFVIRATSASGKTAEAQVTMKVVLQAGPGT